MTDVLKVNGNKVPDSVFEAVLKRMTVREFRAENIIQVVRDSWTKQIDFDTAGKVADLLIQKHRVAGDIEQIKQGQWRWKSSL